MSDHSYTILCAHLSGAHSTHITREWHRAHGSFVCTNAIVQSAAYAEILDRWRSEHPDERFWSNYMCAHKLPHTYNDSKFDMLRSSALLGNPYAMYKYVHECTRHKDKVSAVHKLTDADIVYYLSTAAAIGHYDATMKLIGHYIGDIDIVTYCCKSTARTVHLLLDKILPYINILYEEANIGNNYFDMCARVYHVASINNYPCPPHSQSYSCRFELCIASLKILEADNSMDVLVILIQHKELCRRYEHAQNKIAQLQTLRSMTLDDVCKSIISEYMS